MTPKLRLSQIEVPEFARLARQFADWSYEQAPAFALRTAKTLGASCEFVSIADGSEVVALASLRIKRLPLLRLGVAYANRGPLVGSGVLDEGEACRAAIDSLVEEYVRRRGLVLRLLMPIRAEPFDIAHRLASDLPKDGQGRGRRAYRTILVDISAEETAIRDRLHQKWRNVLVKSERQDIEIVSGTSLELFDRFEVIFKELRERKDFFVDLDPAFFRSVQANLPEEDRFEVRLAYSKGELVSGHIGSYHGRTAVYLFGASTEAGNRLGASYRLQWEAIRAARAAGCAWYDLGGIDRDGNPGVFRFKNRMGGQEAVAAGPCDYASPARRALLHVAERAYRLTRAGET